MISRNGGRIVSTSTLRRDEDQYNHCGNLAFSTKARLTNHQETDKRTFKQLICYGSHAYLIK